MANSMSKEQNYTHPENAFTFCLNFSQIDSFATESACQENGLLSDKVSFDKVYRTKLLRLTSRYPNRPHLMK